MSNELTVIEVTEDKYPEIYCEGGLQRFIDIAKESVNETPDLESVKGRKRVATLAAQVGRSKTAVEKPGRAYLKHLKAQPKIIEKELREFVQAMDALRDETRQPLTDWEEEQKRIDAENKFLAEWDAAITDNKAFDIELAHQLEVAHMEAIIDNIAFDKAAEEAEEIERLRREAEEKERIEREEKMKRQAAEDAVKEAKEKEQSLEREKQQLIIDGMHSEALLINNEIDSKTKAIKDAADKKAAEEQAKRDADAAAEMARQAEIAKQEREAKRLADEKAKRESDRDHAAKIHNQMVDAFVANGYDEEGAKQAVTLIARGLIPNCQINY